MLVDKISHFYTLNGRLDIFGNNNAVFTVFSNISSQTKQQMLDESSFRTVLCNIDTCVHVHCMMYVYALHCIQPHVPRRREEDHSALHQR